LWLQSYKKRYDNNFFYPSLLLLFLDPGSEIWDLGSGMGKNQDPGSGIRDKYPGSATLAGTLRVYYKIFYDIVPSSGYLRLLEPLRSHLLCLHGCALESPGLESVNL
jgi:hypothetical protein